MNPRFYFAACQTGAEKAVKAEVLAAYPQLRFAFSRPGFITFKEEVSVGRSLALAAPVFTRLWGTVVAQTRDRAELPAILSRIPEDATVQCFDRDQFVPGDEPGGFVRNANIRAVLDAAGYAIPKASPAFGAEIFSLIWVDDFHVFLGCHVRTANISADPGNVPDISVPAESPSRAYLKIEEAFYRFGTGLKAGSKVLEVGCAPGGASTAMLNRGIAVTGIDPQNIDARVLARAEFRHVKKFARYVADADLRGFNPDAIVMDMSIAPNDAISELAHVVSVLRGLFGAELAVREAYLTIKLNDWKYATDIPSYLARLRKIGFESLRPMQLASNRQEFFVYAGGFR